MAFILVLPPPTKFRKRINKYKLERKAFKKLVLTKQLTRLLIYLTCKKGLPLTWINQVLTKYQSVHITYFTWNSSQTCLV